MPRPPESVATWSPPLGTQVKINVDASLFPSTKSVGIGVVARNSTCNILDWRQKELNFVVSPALAETIAIQQGIDMAMELGFQNVIMESDCLGVLQDISSSSPCLATGGHVIDDIKCKVSFSSSIIFSHVLRTANTVAHDMSKHVVGDNSGHSDLPF